jgi:hypothetical protein
MLIKKFIIPKQLYTFKKNLLNIGDLKINIDKELNVNANNYFIKSPSPFKNIYKHDFSDHAYVFRQLYVEKDKTFIIHYNDWNKLKIYCFFHRIGKPQKFKDALLEVINPVVEQHYRYIKESNQIPDFNRDISQLHLHNVMKYFKIFPDEQTREISEEYLKSFFYKELFGGIQTFNTFEVCLMLNLLDSKEFNELVSTSYKFEFENFHLLELTNLLHLTYVSNSFNLYSSTLIGVIVDKLTAENMKIKIKTLFFILTRRQDTEMMKQRPGFLQSIIDDYNAIDIDSNTLGYLIVSLLEFKANGYMISETFINQRLEEFAKYTENHQVDEILTLLMVYLNDLGCKLSNKQLKAIFANYIITLEGLSSIMKYYTSKIIYQELFMNTMNLFRKYKKLNKELLDAIVLKFGPYYMSGIYYNDTMLGIEQMLSIVDENQLQLILANNKPDMEALMEQDTILERFQIVQVYMWLIINKKDIGGNITMLTIFTNILRKNGDKYDIIALFMVLLKMSKYLDKVYLSIILKTILDICDLNTIFSLVERELLVSILVPFLDLNIETQSYNRLVTILFSIVFHKDLNLTKIFSHIFHHFRSMKVSFKENSLYALIRIISHHKHKVEKPSMKLIFQLLIDGHLNNYHHQHLQYILNYFDNLYYRNPVDIRVSFTQLIDLVGCFLKNNLISLRSINSLLICMETIKNGFSVEEHVTDDYAKRANLILRELAARKIIHPKIANELAIKVPLL